jgi:hypothetical protein
MFLKHWNFARGIEKQEFLPTLPCPLLDEFRSDLAFGQHEADEAGTDGKRVVEKRDHAGKDGSWTAAADSMPRRW